MTFTRSPELPEDDHDAERRELDFFIRDMDEEVAERVDGSRGRSFAFQQHTHGGHVLTAVRLVESELIGELGERGVSA